MMSVAVCLIFSACGRHQASKPKNETNAANSTEPVDVRTKLADSWISTQGHYFAFDSSCNVVDEGLLLQDSRGKGFIPLGTNTYTIKYEGNKPSLQLGKDGRSFVIEEIDAKQMRVTSQNQVTGIIEDCIYMLVSRDPKAGTEQFGAKSK